MWGKREDELERCILTLHFYFYFRRSIICTWRSASGFHNNLSHWKTAGSANLQLSAFQGLLMEPRFPVRQAAHCWHVPGGLARGWERSEVELRCGETAAICPLSLLGGAATQKAWAHLLKPEGFTDVAGSSEMEGGDCLFSSTLTAIFLS